MKVGIVGAGMVGSAATLTTATTGVAAPASALSSNRPDKNFEDTGKRPSRARLERP